MENIDTTTDPRYALFQQLINAVKNKQPQVPFETTEIDIRQYTDEAWFDYEKTHIFSDVPLIIGCGAMLKEAGDHFTLDHAGKPLLIVRGKDGKLRCFLNVCRHRGVRLSNAEEVAKARTFSCQYHHWTYDLEGKLIFVPSEEGFPELDKSCRALKELAIEEKYGFIWVNPKVGGSINLDQFLGNLAVDLDKFGIAESHYFKQATHICNANWKLIIEAFQDGYHVTRLHNKTVGKFFLDNMTVQERTEQHIRSIVARKGFEEAMNQAPATWNFRQQSSFAHFIWPNTITIIHPDYTSQVSLYPIAVDKTIIIHNCVVEREPQSEKEQAHFERSFKLIDEGVFASEDFYICEQAQLGMKSGANDTLLIGGYESGIRTFHQILRDSIGTYGTHTKGSDLVEAKKT